MKDNAFDRAMSQIVNEAHAEQQRDLRNMRHQRLMGRLKVVACFVVGLATLTTAFCYRAELQDYVSAKLDVKRQKVTIVDGKVIGGDTNAPEGAATANISKAAENAARRDSIIDQGLNAK
jgi:hypothetical protein